MISYRINSHSAQYWLLTKLTCFFLWHISVNSFTGYDSLTRRKETSSVHSDKPFWGDLQSQFRSISKYFGDLAECQFCNSKQTSKLSTIFTKHTRRTCESVHMKTMMQILYSSNFFLWYLRDDDITNGCIFTINNLWKMLTSNGNYPGTNMQELGLRHNSIW